jgi:preprotein translocase subunit SecG
MVILAVIFFVFTFVVALMTFFDWYHDKEKEK